MIEKTVDERLEYGGESLILNGMQGMFCPECGEGVWDGASYRRYVEAQAAMMRAVTGDVGGDIRRIRKRLQLTQAELAALFGVGKIAFSRYERGETRPPARWSNCCSCWSVILNCWPNSRGLMRRDDAGDQFRI